MPLLLLMQSRGSGQGQGQTPSKLQQAGQAEILEFPRRTAGSEEQQQVRSMRQCILSSPQTAHSCSAPQTWYSMLMAMGRLKPSLAGDSSCPACHLSDLSILMVAHSKWLAATVVVSSAALFSFHCQHSEELALQDPPMVRVRLSVHYRVHSRQMLCIGGSQIPFGWSFLSIAKVPMAWNQGDIWTAEVRRCRVLSCPHCVFALRRKVHEPVIGAAGLARQSWCVRASGRAVS